MKFTNSGKDYQVATNSGQYLFLNKFNTYDLYTQHTADGHGQNGNQLEGKYIVAKID